jgi:hypothetical protein
MKKVLPFVVVANHNPDALALDSNKVSAAATQLDLFPVEASVLSGQL